MQLWNGSTQPRTRQPGCRRLFPHALGQHLVAKVIHHIVPTSQVWSHRPPTSFLPACCYFGLTYCDVVLVPLWVGVGEPSTRDVNAIRTIDPFIGIANCRGRECLTAAAGATLTGQGQPATFPTHPTGLVRPLVFPCVDSLCQPLVHPGGPWFPFGPPRWTLSPFWST